MSDEHKDPELQTWIDPELEARVVAWVVGEASEFEAAELARIVAEKPELAIFKRRIEVVHGLVTAASRLEMDPMRLSEERRRKLLEKLGHEKAGAPAQVVAMPQGKAEGGWRFSWGTVIGIAACLLVVALLGSISLPAFSSVQKRSAFATKEMQERMAAMAKAEEEANNPVAASAPHFARALALTPAPTPSLAALDSLKALARQEGDEEHDYSMDVAFDKKRAITIASIAWEDAGMPGPTVQQGDQQIQAAPGLPAAMAGRAASSTQFSYTGATSVSAGNTMLADTAFSRMVPGYAHGVVERSKDADATAGEAAPAELVPQARPAAQEERAVAAGGAGGAPANADATAADAGDVIADAEKKAAAVGRTAELDRFIQYKENQINRSRNTAKNEMPDSAADIAEDRKHSEAQLKKDAAKAVEEVRRYAGQLQAQGPVGGGLGITSAASTVASTGGNRFKQTANAYELITKEYTIPAAFFDTPPPADGRIAVRQSSPDYWSAHGVKFPPGATAIYDPDTGRLIFHDTPANIQRVENLLKNAPSPAPPQKAPTPEPQDEINASDQPYSTFSLHVSDVSFLLAQAALARGQLPDGDSIRPEEFYNAFDYGDPAPGPGEKIACHIEQAAHPVLQERNLVRIAMKVAAAGRGDGQPLRLTVLLDTSGSMEREDRAASVRRAMEVLTSLLGPKDAVTLIGFARQPRLLAEEVPGNQAAKLVGMVAHTPREGGTNMEEAIKTASELALRHYEAGGQNRVVLLTDGAANLGDADPEQLSKLVERLRQQGVSFDACGVGADGLNDGILEALTRKGGGRYYFLNQPEDADEGFARQLAGAFRPAAENVKMQVRFNPSRVGKYRLIGFEKHRLNQEDFRNDKVTAAQLAAEEAAVALYQVQVLPEGEGEVGEVFVRFRDPSDGRMVEQSWTIPYDAAAAALERAAPSMQLAATASLLAEKLRGGAPANAVDLDALAPVVAQVRNHYAQQERVRQLAEMFEQVRRMTTHR